MIPVIASRFPQPSRPPNPCMRSTRFRGQDLQVWQVMMDLGQLGRQTQMDPMTGLVVFNHPLLSRLVSYGPQVLPGLREVLATSMERLQVVEALYLSQKLAEARVPGTRQLFATTTRFHDTPDPLIQIYLAGFYRYINEPAVFGPLMQMLMRNAWTPQTPWRWGPRNLDPAEEIGGTLLAHIRRYV